MKRRHSNETFATSDVLKNNIYLKTHVASVHEGKKPFRRDICDYSCSLKGSMNNMEKHVAAVHEEKKPFKNSMSPNLLKRFTHQQNIKLFW